MVKRASTWLALACLAAGSHALAAEPSAEDIARARPVYTQALELYNDGAFDAALVEFEKAYAIAPSYRLLYNIALVNAQLNDFAQALRAYRRYLEEGGKKVDAKRRAEVEREIKKLESRVAEITLSVSVDGAEVSVDDLPVGTSPLGGPLLVNSGRRKLSAAKAGHTPVSRVLVVSGGTTSELSLELRPTASPPSGDGPKPSPSDPARGAPRPEEGPTRPVPWVWWGVTGALAAGTATFGLLTLSAQSDLDAKRESPAKKSELDDAATKTRTLAVVTDVTLVATLAVGGYALYQTFFSPPPEREATRSVDVLAGPRSLSVVGRF